MKVGDRVKIKNCDNKVIGEGVIEEVTDGEHFYRINNWYYCKDLLELIPPPPLIIEPGKEYVSRDGCWNRCLANDLHSDQPILLERKCTHYGYSLIKVFTNGKFWNSENDHDLDIIGLWNPKPIADWSLYSKWTKAVAMDNDGRWFGYSKDVIKQSEGWRSIGNASRIPPEYAPKNPDGTPWDGPWEESLCIRPEGE